MGQVQLLATEERILRAFVDPTYLLKRSAEIKPENRN